MLAWYVRLAGGMVQGPFSELQIRNGLERGKIGSDMQIRQHESPWMDSARVQTLFQRLTERGFYVRDELDKVHGPFTKARILAMDESGALPGKYWIRRGNSGKWTPIESPSDEMQATCPNKLPTIPPAPVMRLRHNSWGDRFTEICERFEYVILGDPLASG